MRVEEQVARELATALEPALPGASIAVAGMGVHWHVDLRVGARSARVHCFVYGDLVGALVLGPRGNSHLSRVQVGPELTIRQGAEFLVYFAEGDLRVADGRTQEQDAAIAALADWLVARRSLAEIHAAHPFVDRHRRALQRLAAAIDPALAAAGAPMRAVLEDDGSLELWVYGPGRSCVLAWLGDDRADAGFVLRHAQLARGAGAPAEVAAAVARWLGGATLEALAAALPGLALAESAGLYARGEVAAWHWANVLRSARAELAAGQDGALGFYVPLLERVVATPAVARFFAFTSLDRLCFSRCSHFPFATEGLPIVHPAGRAPEPRYQVVCGEAHAVGDADATVATLAAMLSTVAEAPFHGTVEDLLVEPVNAEFARLGSPLRAARVQRRQWFDTRVARGSRSCTLWVQELGRERFGLTFHGDGARHVASAEATGSAELARCAQAWLIEGRSLDELAAVVPGLERRRGG